MEFFSFKDAVEAMRKDLSVEFRENFPWAVAAALSRTAVQCRDRMKKHAIEAFKHPTPYTESAFMAVPATPEKLAAAVALKPGGGSKMTPAQNYLGPEIDGGGRRQKRSEKAFAAAGFINPGAYITPGSSATLNQYGNQSTGEIVKIMSILRAFGEQGYSANRKSKWVTKSRVGQIFVVRAGHGNKGLKPGVYKRTAGGGVKCMMIFVNKAPEYQVRLPMRELVHADADEIFPAELAKAVVESKGWKKKG